MNRRSFILNFGAAGLALAGAAVTGAARAENLSFLKPPVMHDAYSTPGYKALIHNYPELQTFVRNSIACVDYEDLRTTGILLDDRDALALAARVRGAGDALASFTSYPDSIAHLNLNIQRLDSYQDVMLAWLDNRYNDPRQVITDYGLEPVANMDYDAGKSGPLLAVGFCGAPGYHSAQTLHAIEISPETPARLPPPGPQPSRDLCQPDDPEAMFGCAVFYQDACLGLIEGVVDGNGPRAGSAFLPICRVFELHAFYRWQAVRQAQKPLTANELRQSSARCIMPRAAGTHKL